MTDIKKKEEKSDFPQWAYDMSKESAMATDDFFIFMEEWHEKERQDIYIEK